MKLTKVHKRLSAEELRLVRVMALVGVDLNGYMAKVQEIPLLSREEESVLATVIQEGRDARDKAEAWLETNDVLWRVAPGRKISLRSARIPKCVRTALAGEEAKLRLVFHNLRFALWAARVSKSRWTPWRPIREVPPPLGSEESKGTVITALSRFARDKLPLEDRIQEANIGLILSAEKFRPGMGAKFVTHAAWMISKRITQAVLFERYRMGRPAEGDSGVGQVVGMSRVSGASSGLRRRTGQEPSLEMIIADAASGKVEAIGRRLEELAMYPRETLEDIYAAGDPYDSVTGEPFQSGDHIWEPDAPNGEDFLRRADLWDALGEVLATLSEREAGVIRLRWGLMDNRMRSLDEVGMVYGVSRERIRQIESKTMTKLRHPMRSKQLEQYLDEPAQWQWYGVGHSHRPSHRGMRRRSAEDEDMARTEPPATPRYAITLSSHPELYLGCAPCVSDEARAVLASRQTLVPSQRTEPDSEPAAEPNAEPASQESNP